VQRVEGRRGIEQLDNDNRLLKQRDEYLSVHNAGAIGGVNNVARRFLVGHVRV
jgi:hypothetical protein